MGHIPEFPLRRVLDEFRAGQRVYLPGASGEILALADTMAADSARIPDLEFVSCLVPGMNQFDYAGLNERIRVSTFMLPSAFRQSFTEGRIKLYPLSYSRAASFIAERNYDITIAHVAPPAADGKCSYGIASDFTPLAWPRARMRIAVINRQMPAMSRGPKLDLSQANVVIETNSDLIEHQPNKASRENNQIASLIANLVPDGAHLQTGIGGAPSALWDQLCNHRGLRLRSGMANDGLRTLYESGALATDRDHVAGIAYGSAEFYAFLRHTDLVRFASTLETHDARALTQIDRFHSINGALEVDLFGQVNFEWHDGRVSSGVGGATDFSRAASASNGGRSIVALTSTARQGRVSRIVSRSSAPAIGLPRCDIDTVVTECGVAHLRDLTLHERADALIEIAHPSFRQTLTEQWRELAARF